MGNLHGCIIIACCMVRGLGPCMISIAGVQTCYTSDGAEGGGTFFLPIYIQL